MESGGDGGGGGTCFLLFTSWITQFSLFQLAQGIDCMTLGGTTWDNKKRIAFCSFVFSFPFIVPNSYRTVMFEPRYKPNRDFSVPLHLLLRHHLVTCWWWTCQWINQLFWCWAQVVMCASFAGFDIYLFLVFLAGLLLFFFADSLSRYRFKPLFHCL